MRTILPIIRKEFIHIRRDPRTLAIIIIMPILQMMLFGYAIDMDVKGIRLGIYDQSQTPASRELVRKFTGSDYFEQRETIKRRSEIEDLFRSRKIKAALVIPADFAESIRRETNTPIQVLVDGSDANTGSIVLNSTRQLLSEASLGLSSLPALPLQVTYSIWYNPEQESSHFIVPGLIAVLMMMICALLTSIAITREKETGTMEQLLVAPVKPYQIIIGKVLPYVVLAAVAATAVLLVGRFWFKVPFNGNPLLLVLLSLIYLITALSLGILISTIARSQQTAMMLALMGTLMPSVILSGFVFPVRSMPVILQAISKVIPATHFLVIIRGILLKGNTILVLWPFVLYLLLLSMMLLAISVRRFKVRLE
jgi:ABC-2 type transport system permease protein